MIGDGIPAGQTFQRGIGIQQCADIPYLTFSQRIVIVQCLRQAQPAFRDAACILLKQAFAVYGELMGILLQLHGHCGNRCFHDAQLLHMHGKLHFLFPYVA